MYTDATGSERMKRNVVRSHHLLLQPNVSKEVLDILFLQMFTTPDTEQTAVYELVLAKEWRG